MDTWFCTERYEEKSSLRSENCGDLNLIENGRLRWLGLDMLYIKLTKAGSNVI